MLESRRDQHGFSLVELLVVVLILGVVGGVTVTGLVRGFRTSAAADARIVAYTDLQRASERVSRDLRRGVWTHTYVSSPTAPSGCEYLTLSPDSVTLIILDDGARFRHRYQLTGGVLNLTRQTWTGSAWGAGESQEVVRGISNGAAGDPIFSYLDGDGRDVLADGFQDVDRGHVRKFRLSLKSGIAHGQGTAEITTVVGARNGGLSCPAP